MVVSAAAIVLAPQIVSLFLAEDQQVQEIGTLALRLQCALIPLFAFTCLANMMLQTMGIAGRATVLAMARQGLFFIPAVWLLERAFGFWACSWRSPWLTFSPFCWPFRSRCRSCAGCAKKSPKKKLQKKFQSRELFAIFPRLICGGVVSDAAHMRGGRRRT